MTDKSPTSDDYRPVVLRVLSNGETLAFRELHEKVADAIGLDETTREELIPSGQARYINRIAWACSGLTQAGLLNRPKRGHYEITDDGKVVDSRNLSKYSEIDMLEWPVWQAYQDEIAARKKETSASSDDGSSQDESESKSPSEVMAHTEQMYNLKVETELRSRLQQASPEFFEKAVLELLWAMGYGGAKDHKVHVGKPHDGGIDGIISQDALGLTNVYVQAKRYADNNRVGEREIRNFFGSLDAKGASLGVFITTSSFLPSAEETAKGYRHGRVILIDGKALTRHLLEYGVAVQKKQEFTLYEIDEDFFEEEES